ncbi:elongation factor P [Candidatus Uhrbacteria bacterium]|jgi:elongation factor P|nr:elongation factor P [Candidatus Uhrbacteria bacterium]
MASPNEIKKGTVIARDGNLWVVVDFQRVSPGKGGSFVRTKMKSLSSGKVKEENLKASENLDFADVMNKKMQYIFSDAQSHTFMDGVSFEQVAISLDIVGDSAKYLKEGLEVVVVVHEGTPISLDVPGKIEYTVDQTEPAVKGDTVSGNVTKEATMDNGLTVRVPIFIKNGDVIRVNTDSGDYSERVSR